MVKTLLVEIDIGFSLNRKLLWLLLMGPYFSSQVVAKPLSYSKSISGVTSSFN